MNRPIKFRGKWLDTGEWVYGFVVLVGERAYILKDVGGLSIEVDPKTVGQYTTMKDKDGIEIYEGDIVKETSDISYQADGSAHESVDAVLWGRHLGFLLYHRYIKSGWQYSGFDVGGISQYEIVGNIYENPEFFGAAK